MDKKGLLVFAIMLLVASSCLTKARKPPAMAEKHELQHEEDQQKMVTEETPGYPESTQDENHHSMDIPDFNRHH